MSNELRKLIESNSLNAIVTGFSFASAIAWMDVVRWVISNVVKVNKSDGTHLMLTAVLTTLLAAVVYFGLRSVSPTVKEPAQPIYAIR